MYPRKIVGLIFSRVTKKSCAADVVPSEKDICLQYKKSFLLPLKERQKYLNQVEQEGEKVGLIFKIYNTLL